MRDILMPEVAKSGPALTVRKWLKSAGQAVSTGETLAQVEGEQGLVELEAAAGGVLVEVVVPAGKSAAAGTVIARMADAQAPKAESNTQSTVEVKMSGDVIPVMMPQAGNSMEEGTIVKWRVKEGDRITKGQIIFEVETDKATVEVEAMEAGRIAKIVVPEGGVQKVKEPVAFLSEGEVAGTPAADTSEQPAALATGPADEGDRREAAFNTMPADVVAVVMPQAGNSMEEGTIVKWRVKEGDRITKGQVIFEVETDKATMEVEATDSGRIAKIVVGEGGVQKVKEPVAYLSESDVNASAAPQKEQPQKAQKAQEQPVTSSSAPSVLSVANSSSGTLKASPAAKKLAKEKGLDLASVGVGSGPGGRILSTDLAKASKEPPKGGTTCIRRKMTKMRKAIAANLTISKQTVPHFYLRATISADAMMAFYKAEKAKYPCSVNDVVTLACAKAIMEFPAFRSKIDPSGDEIVEYPAANIGVAVGVDDGLTVPVLINAQAMTLQQIGQNTRRIAESARAGKLEGYGQGNFTISNLGMFGVEEFSAIVNPPEPAILAVGAAREAVVVKDGAMKPGRVMTMTLSCDHRIIDGLLAAKFMARLKELLESPSTLV